MQKINDKIFPTFHSDNDGKLHEQCIKLSWTEPKNFIIGKQNYIFDSFLPDVIHNFLKLEEEKSPIKKKISPFLHKLYNILEVSKKY